MNEQNNNQNPELEQLEPNTEQNNSVKYEQQANELINSVTMADLVDPNANNEKKNKKGLIVALVVIVLVLGVGSVLLLSTGTYSKIFGNNTTSELDAFKTEEIDSTTTTVFDDGYGQFKLEGNKYIFDISTAGNGKTIKYYLKTNLVAYIIFADDFETSKNFKFNLNNSDYFIEDTNPGELSLTVEEGYISYMNSNNNENQVILSKKGVKLEDDPEVKPEDLSTTTTQTTTTTTKKMVHKDFTFENTTDALGRTTRVETEYDPSWDIIDYIWYDEDYVVHYVFIGTEESKANHPELYTTTVAPENNN